MNCIKDFLCWCILFFLCLLVAGSWGCLKEPDYKTNEENAEQRVRHKLEMLQNNKNW